MVGDKQETRSKSSIPALPMLQSGPGPVRLQPSSSRVYAGERR